MRADLSWLRAACLLALSALACSDDEPASAPRPDALADASPDAGLADSTPPDATQPDAAQPDATPPDAARQDAAPDAAQPDAAPPYPSRPPPTAAATLRAPRDWRFARGLMHMHSVHSHDACDGDPKPDGVPDATCLARFRAAMCHNRFDYVLLTDHPGTFEDIPFPDAFLHAPGDEWIDGADGPIGNWIQCPDGHRVLLTAGSEGDLMPVMMQRKPPPGALRDDSPAGVARLRETASALVMQAHTERFTAADLAPLGLDGIEIYNLHANIAPNGELQQLGQVLPDLAAWINLGAAGPHPDLVWVALFRENPLALATWDGLTPNARVLGFAGSDIHENLPPLVRPPDGDRIDSYRRLSAWFANYFLVDALDFDSLREAIAQGRGFVTFDILGPPDGFDFHARAQQTVVEMGEERPFAPDITLVVEPPTAPAGATLSTRLLRISAEGTQTVAEAEGALDFTAIEPGVYRVEVRIVPGHLAPELGEFGARFIKPLVWIYSNPIYLR